MFKFIVLFVVLITSTACPEEITDHSSFMFYNNSNSDVCIYLGVVPQNNGGSLYPDTMLMNKNVTIGPLLKNSKYNYDFNRLENNDSLSLFIIDLDTIKKYTWEEIKNGYKILQRYDLRVDLEGLKQLDFIVTYPPTEAMKSVRMYPPYQK